METIKDMVENTVAIAEVKAEAPPSLDDDLHRSYKELHDIGEIVKEMVASIYKRSDPFNRHKVQERAREMFKKCVKWVR